MSNVLLIAAMLVILEWPAVSQVVNTPAHAGMRADEMALFPSAAVNWKAGPASLPAGAKMAVLEGDPSKEGPFTMRLSLPDGYAIQPHYHSNVEHVTVISGIFNIGMGEKFDKMGTREMPERTFGFWPAGMRHFAWVKGDTVLQLHGTGPWTITYVNASDDPRGPKKGN
jgi:hypothetical protein